MGLGSNIGNSVYRFRDILSKQTLRQAPRLLQSRKGDSYATNNHSALVKSPPYKKPYPGTKWVSGLYTLTPAVGRLRAGLRSIARDISQAPHWSPANFNCPLQPDAIAAAWRLPQMQNYRNSLNCDRDEVLMKKGKFSQEWQRIVLMCHEIRATEVLCIPKSQYLAQVVSLRT